jgi:SAM-dependent methyltransferase
MKKLNFGCGKDVKEGYLNADICKLPGVDLKFNFDEFPYPFPDNEFGYIFSDNVIEHLDDIPRVFKELHRISSDGAEIRIIVPHYNGYGAYNDVTHRHYFSHKAFEPFYNHVEKANYLIDERYDLKELKLVPTRFGALLLHDSIRIPVSYFIGQVFKVIDMTLIVRK